MPLTTGVAVARSTVWPVPSALALGDPIQLPLVRTHELTGTPAVGLTRCGLAGPGQSAMNAATGSCRTLGLAALPFPFPFPHSRLVLLLCCAEDCPGPSAEIRRSAGLHRLAAARP